MARVSPAAAVMQPTQTTAGKARKPGTPPLPNGQRFDAGGAASVQCRSAAACNRKLAAVMKNIPVSNRSDTRQFMIWNSTPGIR
jgi:hypothetical protein